MRKMLSAAFAAFTIVVTSPAAAQVTQGQYGNVQTVPGGYQLTSSASPYTYAGLYFDFDPGLTLSSLTTLSADYTMTQGSFAVGSPRFSLFDSSNGAAYIYFGTRDASTGLFSDPQTGTTGNYADLLSSDLRVECNGFAGCGSPGYPPITFAQFVAQAGSTGIASITLDLDGGYVGTQQLLVSEFNVNGNLYGAPAAVPEPATWAMMLIGFGGVGFQMRRQRRSGRPLTQAA